MLEWRMRGEGGRFTLWLWFVWNGGSFYVHLFMGFWSYVMLMLLFQILVKRYRNFLRKGLKNYLTNRE